MPNKKSKNTPLRRLLIAFGVAIVIIVAFIFSLVELSRKPILKITEVLSSNLGIVTDAYGDAPDFVEIYNEGTVKVNLKGYYLSDNDNKPLRWKFPSFVLEPGQYIYVFASGKDEVDAGGNIHTNFSIALAGEPILLSDPRGILVDRVDAFEGADNISYARIKDSFAYLAIPTPGAPNTGNWSLTLSELQPNATHLALSEYMSQNTSVYPDENGEFYDWVELYNPNDTGISLAGWCLSDNEKKLNKYSFPGGMVIESKGYLVVRLSGLTEPLHVPFSLSEKDGKLFLSDPNGIISDTIPVHDTPLDTSYGRTLGQQEGFFTKPTPGEENTGNPAKDMASLSWNAPTIRIMEYMSTNGVCYPDEEGDFNDWVELYNYGEETVNLTGFFLSDRVDTPDKWEFPTGSVLESQQRVVYQLSGKRLDSHVSFSLGSDDDILSLGDRYGRMIDEAPLYFPDDHVSIGRREDDIEHWVFFPLATPALPNTAPGFETLNGLTALSWRGLYISEASYENWVEIGNATDSPIRTLGWHVSDTIAEIDRQELEDVTIAPGQLLQVALSFGIANRGETLYLTDDQGLLRDRMDTGALKGSVTRGRIGQDATPLYFSQPTPGKANPTDAYQGYSGDVTASVNEGYCMVGTEVALRSQYGETIRFTLDGKEPTESSLLYSQPIRISGSVVIRARTYKTGFLPGNELIRTYLTGTKHTLPVIALTTAPDNLFSEATGIFANGSGWTETFPHVGANFWKNWERDVHFAYYDETGALALEADAGIKVFGQYSRAIGQKGLQIQFRKEYGINRISYPFFEGNPVSTYGSLLLRASGQDWERTKLRDAYMAKAIQDEMDLDLMDSTPVVVYINGEYWGLYNLREKINEDYFNTHYGVDTDSVDIIKANKNAVAGTSKAYLEFVASLKKLDINTQSAYDYIDANMDLGNWMDYWIMESFYCNTDSGNIKCWKEQGENGKWRWIMFDLDWGMNPSTADPTRYASYAQLCRFLDPKGHGVGNAFSTEIARTIMKNTKIREAFVARYEYHLANTFSEVRMNAILDTMVEEIRPEIQRQADRWGGPSSLSSWERNVQQLRSFLSTRPGQIRDQLKYAINYR